MPLCCSSRLGVNLPFTALRQLAPPMRLMSAALWKVMKQRDVAQYGVLAEFVESTCNTVPGLLTLRHQAKLELGLRARVGVLFQNVHVTSLDCLR